MSRSDLRIKYDALFQRRLRRKAAMNCRTAVYCIVIVGDSLGREHEVWPNLEFESFRFHHAEWKPELTELQRQVMNCITEQMQQGAESRREIESGLAAADEV